MIAATCCARTNPRWTRCHVQTSARRSCGLPGALRAPQASRVNQATIRELLPFAVEDRLLADPSHIHAIAGDKAASGETLVAVVDREWLRAMLNALDDAGLTVSSAWPESDLATRGEWHVMWSAQGGMLVDEDGAAATFDHDARGVFPLALRLALDEAAARARSRRRSVSHVEGPSAPPGPRGMERRIRREVRGRLPLGRPREG